MGLELLDVGIEHFAMLGRRFALEDNAFRVKTVRDGIHGGCFAAGFGFGAAGFSAVGTGGIDFLLGGHEGTGLILGGGRLVVGGGSG